MILSRRGGDLLWTVAQHKYGWAFVGRHRGGLQVADALVRRGLLAYDEANPRDCPDPVVVATEAGAREIGRRWPAAPFVLGTYDSPPGGWSRRDAAWADSSSA